MLARVIVPGVGSLCLGEVSTPRLDRFVQSVLADKGYATAKLTRSVLSGICGWLVRRGALATNPVRDLTPLELDRDRTARALSIEELHAWLALLDASPFARRHDLPELARFMLATGLRLGEVLGVTWADVDISKGTVAVRRTIVRVKGQGLVAKRVKSCVSERGLLLPSWSSSCSVPGGSDSVLSRGRSSQTPAVVGGTAATWARRSARCVVVRTSSG